MSWILQEKSGFPKIVYFFMFLSKSSPLRYTFFCLKSSNTMLEQFCENRMFGKILVLDLWPKMVLTNQITRFFKFEYLKSGLAERLEKYHSNILFLPQLPINMKIRWLFFFRDYPWPPAFTRKGAVNSYPWLCPFVRACVRPSVKPFPGNWLRIFLNSCTKLENHNWRWRSDILIFAENLGFLEIGKKKCQDLLKYMDIHVFIVYVFAYNNAAT